MWRTWIQIQIAMTASNLWDYSGQVLEIVAPTHWAGIEVDCRVEPNINQSLQRRIVKLEKHIYQSTSLGLAYIVTST